MRSVIAIVLMLVVCLAVAEVQAQSPDRILGTWKMNVERSPGGPQSEVRRYQQLEDGFFLYTRSTVNANGNPGFSQVAFKLDGKDYPLYSSGALAQFLTSGKLSAGIMTFTGRGSVGAVLLSLVVVPKAQVGGLD